MDLQEPTRRAERQKIHCGANDTTSIGEPRLVAQAKSGGSNAFAELYDHHRLHIYRTVFRILRNRQDAEDAAKRSFERVLTNLAGFRGDATLRTWVMRIAANEALVLLRQRRANTPFEGGTDDTEARFIFALAETERRAAVLQAFSNLRKSLRMVILFAYCKGLPLRKLLNGLVSAFPQ